MSREEHLTEMVRLGQEIVQADIELGARQERERIIKLLEGLAYIDEQGHEMISEFKTDLIALIKGEQK